MASALKKQAEWFRLFLDSACIGTHFPTEVDAEMRRLNISRPEVMSVISGGKIVRCHYPDAGVVGLVIEDNNCDDQRLRVSVRVENDQLRVGVVWVEKPDGA